MDQQTLYDRQQNPEPVHKDTICVIGTGGMGTWSTIYAAMMGLPKSLILVDGDEIEESNLNRLPFTEEDIGRKKVDVLKEFIEQRRPDLPIITFDEHFTEELWEDRIDISIDKFFFCAEGEAHQIVRNCLGYEINKGNVFFLAGDSREIQLRDKPIGFQSDTEVGDYDDVNVVDASFGGLSLVYNYIAKNIPNRNITTDFNGHNIIPANPLKLKSDLEYKQSVIERRDSTIQTKGEIITDQRKSLSEKNSKIMELERENSELNGKVDRLESELSDRCEELAYLKEAVSEYMEENGEVSMNDTSFLEKIGEKVLGINGEEYSTIWEKMASLSEEVTNYFSTESE